MSKDERFCKKHRGEKSIKSNKNPEYKVQYFKIIARLKISVQVQSTMSDDLRA